MGELVLLSELMADRSGPGSNTARFFFALDCPFSYLAAERVERALGEIDWVPVLGPLSEEVAEASRADRERGARERLRMAGREARSLHLPLVEPHSFPLNSRTAARAAAYAAEEGVCQPFALAVARLAFCGGFDIAADHVIEEAAGVADLDPAATVAASREQRYDLRLDAASRGLHGRRIAPPAISIGNNWFEGPDAVLAALSYSLASRRRETPQVPAS